MKKEYNIPKMEVIIFEQTDVVRTSDTTTETVTPPDKWYE